MRQISECRVFLASPSGLGDVRQAFRDELAHYNQMDALRRGMTFTPVGWEETLAGARRPQALINDDLRTCDAFVLVLHDRWGSAPDKDGSYTSGCQEEFELARACLDDLDHSMSDLLVFFRGVEPKQLADPGEQLSQVQNFRKDLESSKEHLHLVFDELDDFRKLLQCHLANWIRAHESGQPLGPSVPEPLPNFEPVSPSEAKPSDDRNEEVWKDVRMAHRLANEGRLTEAETIFAQRILSDPGPIAVNNYGRFLKDRGRLGPAQAMFERVLSLSENSERWTAVAYADLGVIYQTRGDLERAEQLHRQALGIEERIGRPLGVATAYANLGLIYQSRGDLERAEQLHRHSLELCEQLGRQDGMANAYSHLGLIYKTRGDLERAEQLHWQSLEIWEKAGDREGMATANTNLGLIYQSRGDLKRAEQMHRHSLELCEQLGSQDGMAAAYSNLGLIYKTRGNLERAEQLHRLSLELFEKVGRQEGVAFGCGNLGLIYQTRGDLERAEQLHRQSLELFEKLGHRAGMANAFGNLGAIRKRRDEFDQAREYWTLTKDLFTKLGAPARAGEFEDWPMDFDYD